jgi:hypothetical protein
VRHFPPNQLLAGATIRSGLVNSLLNLLLSVTCCGQFHKRLRGETQWVLLKAGLTKRTQFHRPVRYSRSNAGVGDQIPRSERSKVSIPRARRPAGLADCLGGNGAFYRGVCGDPGRSAQTGSGSPLSTQRQNFRSAVTIRCWYRGSAWVLISTHFPPPVSPRAPHPLRPRPTCCAAAGACTFPPLLPPRIAKGA